MLKVLHADRQFNLPIYILGNTKVLTDFKQHWAAPENKKKEASSLSRVARIAVSLRAATTSELEHIPVEYIVVGKALSVEQISKQLP